MTYGAHQIFLMRKTRLNILKEVENCSPDQLFYIPSQFNNSIIWNMGHLIATLGILVYESSNTPYPISKEFIDKFKKGTFPKDSTDENLIQEIKDMLIFSADQLESDYENQTFGKYIERTTSYGVTLTTIEDAIAYNSLHEGIHIGQIRMLKKLLE